MRRSWIAPVAVAALAAVGVAAIGGTITDLGPWYEGLAKPDWNPPRPVFLMDLNLRSSDMAMQVNLQPNGAIYEALQCQEHNCGCSGCGTEREFTREQLEAGLARLPDGEDYEPERVFLRKCIDAGAGGVRIAFY